MTGNTNSTIMPTLRYHDAPAAIEWLCNVLGFAKHVVYPGPGNTIGHAELTLGNGMIMLGSVKDDAYGKGFKTPAELGDIETRSAYIVVADTDAVYARAQAAGATFAAPPSEHGLRQPRVHRQRSRRQHLVHRHLQPMGTAEIGAAHGVNSLPYIRRLL